MGKLERFERKQRIQKMNVAKAGERAAKTKRTQERAEKTRENVKRYFRWADSQPTSVRKNVVKFGPAIAVVVLSGLAMIGGIESHRIAELERVEAERIEAIAEEARAEQERLDMVEAERIEAIAEKERAEQERLAMVANEADREWRQETFGISAEDFVSTCKTYVALDSGSDDFGVLNDPGILEYPEMGSLVTQKFVYGKNVYGAKIEQQYKCWSNPSGEVSIELIGIKVK